MIYDIVIIGSGLGGLQCAYILAKNGYNVCVLEKNHQIGGCLQSYKRGKFEFDSGFHYIGGLDVGQPLYKLFKYFDLMNLPWHQLDNDNFDEVIINENSYSFASGFDNFCKRMTDYFPDEAKNLSQYTSFVQNVVNNIFQAFDNKGFEYIANDSLFSKSAYEFLNQSFNNKLLINVLSGASLKLELNAEHLPLYTFAQITGSFIASAWRLKGSGSLISNSLSSNIKNMGGTILTNAEVTNLVEVEGKLSYAELKTGEHIEGKYFISDMHPSETFSIISKSRIVKDIFRKRIDRLDNTYGMFTVNIALKESSILYRNRNMYIYDTDNLWSLPHIHDGKVHGVLVYFQVPRDGSKYTMNIDILTPMYWSEVSKWYGTTVGHRGEEYLNLKAMKVEQCIDFVSKYIPNLKENITSICTSTPLSYADYTYTKNGSAYGICKDYQRLLFTLLTPKTPLSNLFLTGQNLNLHGILGVSMTSLLTCMEIPNFNRNENLKEILNDYNTQ